MRSAERAVVPDADAEIMTWRPNRGGPGHELYVPEPPAQALVDLARVREASEIVVGTRGFGDTRTWLGSVSHELLRIADRPVTVVPPAERRAG